MKQTFQNEVDAISFSYDDTQFQSMGDGRLKYIGAETDGANIQVPEGLVDGSEMFEQTGLTCGAKLPESLRIMNNMYRGCMDLKDPGVIPDGVTSMDGAYAYTGIKETPQLPDTITHANFAFDHCNRLERCGNFPANLKEADCMFSGDTVLQELPSELPDTVTDMDGFACGCENLKQAPKTGANVKNMSHAYASATSLEDMPEIPDGAYAKNVVSDCYTLEQKGLSDSSLSATFEKANTFEEKAEKPMNREAALTEMTSHIVSKENSMSTEFVE